MLLQGESSAIGHLPAPKVGKTQIATPLTDRDFIPPCFKLAVDGLFQRPRLQDLTAVPAHTSTTACAPSAAAPALPSDTDWSIQAMPGDFAQAMQPRAGLFATDTNQRLTRLPEGPGLPTGGMNVPSAPDAQANPVALGAEGTFMPPAGRPGPSGNLVSR